jgi:hypothetical protein
MLKVTYRAKTGPKLRMLFHLLEGNMAISGQIYERAEPGSRDRYYWSFGSKFSWEVGETLPPFRYQYEGRDVSFDLYFGIPQLVLRECFGFEPQAAERYRTDNNRNCGNCLYAQFDQATYEEYRDRPISQRYDRPPNSLFGCRITGEHIDDLRQQSGSRSGAGQLLDHARFSLRSNGCERHTRAAYQTHVEPLDRKQLPGGGAYAATRWVPAEHRRLMALNPAALEPVSAGRTTVAGVPLRFEPQRD